MQSTVYLPLFGTETTTKTKVLLYRCNSKQSRQIRSNIYDLWRYNYQDSITLVSHYREVKNASTDPDKCEAESEVGPFLEEDSNAQNKNEKKVTEFVNELKKRLTDLYKREVEIEVGPYPEEDPSAQNENEKKAAEFVDKVKKLIKELFRLEPTQEIEKS